MNPDRMAVSIMGQDVPANNELIAIGQLHFLPENPRVYAAIREMSDFAGLTSDEKQLRIYERLLQEPSVKNLIPEIKRDDGLQNPIIVRWDTRQVVEGNSRLAAYRKLNEEDPDNDRWTHIRCLVVKTLTEDQQTRLLGQEHLHGKTEWPAYAKALFCFRWVIEEERKIEDLANLSGFRVSTIRKNVEIIEMMERNSDNTLSNFSYYDVLVRNRDISSEIKDNEQLRDILLSQIKTKDFTAQEMRKRLPTIIAKPKILRKFEKGDVTLEDAYDRAKISDIEQKLKRIRGDINDIEQDDIKQLERRQINAIQQVVKRIRRDLKRVSDMVETEINANSIDS